MPNDWLKKYWIYILGIIFALAAALGILQSQNDPYSGYPNKSIGTAPKEKDLKAYYKQSLDIQTQEADETTVTFFAVGDIMLSRGVAKKIKEANDPLLPFRPLTPLFKSVDFSFGNLESPISEKSPIIGGHSLIFGAPTDTIKGLVDNNFKVLSLANNHAMDQGKSGLIHTMNLLKNLGISYAGVGQSLNDAWQPTIITANGIDICFIGASYASINDNGKTTNEYVARIENVEKLKSAINDSEIKCDFTVVTMHAGTEYTAKPNKAQANFAHAAIDYGADMVIGHHPHWVQTIERYCPNTATSPWTSPQKEREGLQSSVPSPNEGKVPDLPAIALATAEGQEKLQCANPKYIFYSLGNFIFDQMWSQETREGLTLKIQISKSKAQNELQGPKVPAKLDSIELIPVIIEDYSTPRPATPEETKKILQKIGEPQAILK